MSLKSWFEKRSKPKEPETVHVDDLIILERWDEAEQMMKARLKKNNRDLQAHIKLAKIYESMDRRREAVDEYAYVADRYTADGHYDKAVATLKKNPSIKVEVAGHTDSDGAAAYNEGLSARRATTVRDYLAANGIATDRMTTRGYGESQPIADNGTREGKAQNRRVVLRITER